MKYFLSIFFLVPALMQAHELEESHGLCSKYIKAYEELEDVQLKLLKRKHGEIIRDDSEDLESSCIPDSPVPWGRNNLFVTRKIDIEFENGVWCKGEWALNHHKGFPGWLTFPGYASVYCNANKSEEWHKRWDEVPLPQYEYYIRLYEAGAVPVWF
jgi:hypothetical protein